MYPIMTAGTRPGGPEPGEGEHHGRAGLEAPRLDALDQAGEGGRGRRLHEDALLAGEHPVGAQDLLVTDDVDPAVRVLHGLERRPPVRRVADLDRRRHGARLLDDAILVDRRRAGRLEADHARQLLHAPRAVVFAVPTPVRGDVPGVADGDQVVVGCAAELVHDLERGGLLPLEPERVHRVHECHRVPLGDPPDDRQRLVEVTVHGEDLRAVDRRLRELAEGDRALRHHHEGADPGARRERRRGGRGVARGGADHRPRARLERFGDRHRHPAVLERARGVEPLALEVDLKARVGRLGEAWRRDERRVALAERDDRRPIRHGEEVAVLLDDAGPGLHTGPPSTRIIVVDAATSGRRSIAASAWRMSRSRASWVSMTTGTASRVPRPFWMTFAIEMLLSPRIPATFESTPGRSWAITRR